MDDHRHKHSKWVDRSTLFHGKLGKWKDSTCECGFVIKQKFNGWVDPQAVTKPPRIEE